MVQIGQDATSCANHTGAAAIARCRGCRLAFCDACCAFDINDDIWCEACGSGIEEDARPRYGRGALALTIGFAAVTAVWILKALFLPAPIPYFFFVLVLGYGGSIFWAWNTVSPIFETRPKVTRRRRGAPLPRGAQRA